MKFSLAVAALALVASTASATSVEWTPGRRLPAKWELATGGSCRGSVKLFHRGDFKGRQMSRNVGLFDINEINTPGHPGNLHVRSISVPKGCVAEVYQSEKFKGNKAVFQAGTYKGTIYTQMLRKVHNSNLYTSSVIVKNAVKASRDRAAAPRSKNAAYGKRSHNSLIGHIRQIERELNNEKKQVNSAAYARCTKNTRSNVRLVRHSFATGPRAFGVVGCRRGSRCDSVSRKNIQNMKSHASCVVNSRNLGKANTRKIKQNNNIIRSNHQAIRRTKNRSAKLTREYNVEKRNHKEAESVLRAVRKRLRRSGKLVFTEQEEKVLGVAFLEVVEDLKRTKQRGSVNRLINLIEKLIRDFNAKEALLDKAQRLQLSNKRNLIRTKNVDTTRRNGQNRRLSVSTRTTAAKQRGCQIRFNMFHKVMRTFPQNCVKAHKVFKATMADILRELRVIADIKRLVNRRGGALKKVKSF